jgi:transcriptional regulator with XRE-family HTH domain
MILDTIYENIDYLFKKTGFKRKDVEEKLGLSSGYLSRNKNMTVVTAEKIAEIFNISLGDLLSKDYARSFILAELKEKRAEIDNKIKELEEAE